MMKTLRRNLLLINLLLIAPQFLFAQFWGARQPKPIDTPKDSLKKGEFTWAPKIAPEGPILVLVSLSEQKAYTYRNGVLIGISTISSGKKGHETPTGVFHTMLKDAKHRSSKYNNAAMPYTQKFTSFGIALHAGGLPGYPSSHGCVHLPSEYARLLYEETPLGMTVVVSNETSSPESLNHPAFLSPVYDKGNLQPHERLSESETYRWTPEKSSTGPISILISRSDKRLVVLRNGTEIGRCKVTVKNETDSIGTVLYVAQKASEANQIKWTANKLSDNYYGRVANASSTSQMERIKIPDEFLQKCGPVIAEGTTLLVTDAPILRKTSGKEMTVLTSKEQ